MTESRRIRLLAAVATVGVAALAFGGCSSTDTAEQVSTCTDLQSLAKEFRGLRDVDVARTGIDGLETRTNAISDAWGQAKTTGEQQFGKELDAFDASLENLRTTLRSASDKGSSIGETASAVRSDISKISASWTDLTKAVDGELKDCDLSGK